MALNKEFERYNTKIEIPVSIILQTIFSTDNKDVETLSRWALKYGFVDLVEKEDGKYYQLQDDYEKQSFYTYLSKKERKQYEYEDYLIDQLQQKENIKKEVREYIEKDTRWFDSEYAKTYGELCTCKGANSNRLEVLVNPSNLLEILDKENKPMNDLVTKLHEELILKEQEINELKSIIRRIKEKVNGVKEINNEVYKQTDMLERFYSRKWCNDEMDNFLEILDEEVN